MLVYFILLLVVVLSALFAKKARHKGFARFFIFIAFASMVLVAGLRADSVGTDTRTYVRSFEFHVPFAEQWEGSTMEPGYIILKFLAGLISGDYWALLTMIAAVTVFFYMLSIYRYSVNPMIALFVLITMGYYTFFFNGARQGIACAIYTVAIGALLNGNFKKYVAWVLLASLFHKSAIVGLPLYFLFRREFTKYVFLLSIMIAFVILYVQGIFQLGGYIAERYGVYQELDTTGGRLLTIFYVLLSLFFIAFRFYVANIDRQAYDCLLQMLILGATIYVIVTLLNMYVEVTRIAVYFQVASVFLWPIVFRNVSARLARPMLAGLVVCCNLIFFYIFLDKMGNLAPYEFNQMVVNWFV